MFQFNLFTAPYRFNFLGAWPDCAALDKTSFHEPSSQVVVKDQDI